MLVFDIMCNEMDIACDAVPTVAHDFPISPLRQKAFKLIVMMFV